MGETDQGRSGFWGWPGARNLAYAYLVLGPILLGWFVLVYAGADYLTHLHAFRVPLYCSWELAILFVPGMVLVYNSLHLAYALAPFILRTRPEMNAMALVWIIITAVAGVFFLIVPFEAGFPIPPDTALGPWQRFYRLADDANLTFNLFPSLHIAWALVCVDVYSGKANRAGKLLMWCWGLAMMLATLLTHFHHVADVLGGLMLALFGSRMLYPWLLKRGESAQVCIRLYR